MPRSSLRIVALVSAAALALVASATGSSSQDRTPQPVHFTAVGDIGARPTADATLREIAAVGSDLTLALGDLSYADTADENEWCDYVKERVGEGYPFELIAGNHESDGLDGHINNFSACLPNQLPGVVGTYGRQWYVDVPADAPSVRFVMISPNLNFPDGKWGYGEGSERYQWTEAAIDGARAAGIPWVVAGMHFPCQTLGQYGCALGSDMMNLLVEKKVDLVLHGHEHMYQRTHQLAHSAQCTTVPHNGFDPDCVVDTDDTLRAGEGTVFVTVGTGGITLRNGDGSDNEAGYFRTWSALNNDPTHGLLDVDATADTLTARFVPTATGTFTDAFVISNTPLPNQPPTAGFNADVTDLSVDFTSTSVDVDGSIDAYAWDFGDGGSATTANPTYTYSAAGTYSVSLTVTDDEGATDTVTRDVEVADPPPVSVLASDTFSRTVSSGWGSADVGGAWALGGGSGNFSVAGGVGTASVAAGRTRTAYLPGVSETDLDMRLSVSFDKPQTGSGTYLSVFGRRVSSSTDYSLKLRVNSAGSVFAQLVSRVDGAQSYLQTETLSGLTLDPGEKLSTRVRVSGTSPTTLEAKVWEEGAAEPPDWMLSATGSAGALQTSGSPGLKVYLSSGASNGPITSSYDDLTVETAD